MRTEGEVRARHFATGNAVVVRWAEGRISEVKPAADAIPADYWIAPSLFDLQLNGYAGVDFQQDHVALPDLLKAARALAAAGCCRFFIALITDDWPRMLGRLRRLRALMKQSPELQQALAGWHLEGPFLSAEPGFHGAHDPALMRDPTPAHAQELRAVAGEDPLLVTVSPERAGSVDFIRAAVSNGIVVSLGHTNASAQMLHEAIEAGATAFTHLGNGCPQMLDRHDNILWRIFERPELKVSLIPDRIHLSPIFFRLAHRLVQPGHILYTTDAMAAAGAPPGRYQLGKLDLEVGRDQVVRQPGKPLFAGSALRPIDGVVRAAQMLDCSWQEAWPRLSTVPANLVGLRNELTVGEPADFCLLKTTEANGRLSSLELAQSDH